GQRERLKSRYARQRSNDRWLSLNALLQSRRSLPSIIAVLVTSLAENSDVVFSFSGYSSASEIAYCYLNGGKFHPPKVNPQSKLGFGWEDPNLYHSCDEVGESSGSLSQFVSDQNPNSWSPSPAQFASSSDQTQTETQVRKETKPSCSSAVYKRREATLVKKSYELSTLCGIDVCIICYDREGELIKTWPEDRDMSERFSRLSDKEKKKKSVDLSRFLNKMASNDKKVSEASLECRTNVVSKMINVGGYEDQSFWDNLYNEDAFGLNNNFQANTTTDDYMIDDFRKNEENLHLGSRVCCSYKYYGPVLLELATKQCSFLDEIPPHTMSRRLQPCLHEASFGPGYNSCES
ncbi:unnamed protein product, partial [Thlaspi arvense]